ncbi:RteC domain-containing protein [Chryseobacterium populi]|uniref:RteC protein n=1 Tax=Chryseobacterium populi TaxID=1144316 RepID=J2T7K8_9FLAO|nr:RteC domain-containing protein [Chryseobacterium populi]EJL74017.1 RteC protein [Chryseobacterium populi]
MKELYKTALLAIENEEKNIARSEKNVINEMRHLISFLQKLLIKLKSEILAKGFNNTRDEIFFFKHVKPIILGKLIYYNRILRIESCSPINDYLIENFYEDQLKILDKDNRKYFQYSNFYKYYRSGRTDLDEKYFRLGQIDILEGVNSYVFEIDSNFSTYYDYETAKIIALNWLHSYLSSKKTKIQPKDENFFKVNDDIEISWTESKNALIELIYALHISNSISNGRAGLTNISKMFEDIFKVNLGDIHHAFYQMKYRAGTKTRYLHFLINSLERYMDNDL